MHTSHIPRSSPTLTASMSMLESLTQQPSLLQTLSPATVRNMDQVIGSLLALLSHQPAERPASEAQIGSLKKARAPRDSCAICLHPCGRQTLRMGCGHVFDEDCLKNWLRLRNSCPLCRTAISADLSILYPRS